MLFKIQYLVTFADEFEKNSYKNKTILLIGENKKLLHNTPCKPLAFHVIIDSCILPRPIIIDADNGLQALLLVPWICISFKTHCG